MHIWQTFFVYHLLLPCVNINHMFLFLHLTDCKLLSLQLYILGWNERTDTDVWATILGKHWMPVSDWKNAHSKRSCLIEIQYNLQHWSLLQCCSKLQLSFDNLIVHNLKMDFVMQ